MSAAKLSPRNGKPVGSATLAVILGQKTSSFIEEKERAAQDAAIKAQDYARAQAAQRLQWRYVNLDERLQTR